MYAHMHTHVHADKYPKMRALTCIHLIWTLPTIECSIYASPHQSMVDYTGHFMTYVILSILSKMTGCCVNFRIYQNMST